MQEKIIVSVIMPLYNEENILRNALILFFYKIIRMN